MPAQQDRQRRRTDEDEDNLVAAITSTLEESSEIRGRRQYDNDGEAADDFSRRSIVDHRGPSGPKVIGKDAVRVADGQEGSVQSSKYVEGSSESVIVESLANNFLALAG